MEEPTPTTWYFPTLDQCLQSLGTRAFAPVNSNTSYCNGTWDTVLCWPATPVNSTIALSCPPMRGLDVTKFAHKKCGPEGRWEGRLPGNYSVPQGWTNYSDCFTNMAKKIYEKHFSCMTTETIKGITFGIQLLDMAGLIISFISIVCSILVFTYFRHLRCHRTRIHKHLFLAILIHVSVRLVRDADYLVARASGRQVAGSTVTSYGTIYSTPVLCEVLVAVGEYTRTVMFMWMFIEGFYLHNIIVVTVFSGKPNYFFYYTLGWGFPFSLTIIWALVNGLWNKEVCWYGYVYEDYYWILEGPRATIIVVNMLFLINIIRVLVTKLRNSNSTEAAQVRKAVRAAIILLPLLGFNNVLSLLPASPCDVTNFTFLYVLDHVTSSLQGFFIALLHCILNGEVQSTLRAAWQRFKQERAVSHRHWPLLSRSLSLFSSLGDTAQANGLAASVVSTASTIVRNNSIPSARGSLRPSIGEVSRAPLASLTEETL